MKIIKQPAINKVLLAGFFISILLVGCEQQQTGFISLAGETMGTTYSVKVSSDTTEQASEKLKEEVDSLLLDINQVFSTYIKDSEVSRLNNALEDVPTDVSKRFIKVLDEALSISHATEGAYDITVGPLVNLWGFGPTFTGDKLPNESDIESVKKTIGFTQLNVNHSEQTVTKDLTSIYVDFSSIAKGYGVDEVAALLDSKGYQDYMVEIGGEMKVRGLNSAGTKWRIAVEKPEASGRSIHRIINISNTAVATSGGYRNFFEKDGVRYSHTLHPKTGWPVQHQLAAVTVLAENSMTADAWATAFMVLGVEKGYDLAMENKLAVLFLTNKDGVINEKATPYFEQVIEERQI